MKKKLVAMLGLTMMVALVTACGSNTEQTGNVTETTESTEVVEAVAENADLMTYEFETFDGMTVVIHKDTIISQEACDNPFEWDGLPADAEPAAPGRDYVLYEDAENYYVEDGVNNLVTVAFKELGDIADMGEFMTYEFETYDGYSVAIHVDTIISQETCEDPLAWDGLPADAEQIAPGRDCILFEDAENYYVEDVTNKLVTVAFKEQGDVIEDTDIAIYDNGVFTFSCYPEDFTVVEAEGSVIATYTNKDVQTAGTNTITFTELVNTDAKEIVKTYMDFYNASEDEMVENYLGGDDVKGYTYSTGILERDDSDLKICETFYAVPCGENVIFIDKLRTYGSDMDLENSLDAQLDEVVLSFHLD